MTNSTLKLNEISLSQHSLAPGQHSGQLMPKIFPFNGEDHYSAGGEFAFPRANEGKLNDERIPGHSNPVKEFHGNPDQASAYSGRYGR